MTQQATLMSEAQLAKAREEAIAMEAAFFAVYDATGQAPAVDISDIESEFLKNSKSWDRGSETLVEPDNGSEALAGPDNGR